MELKDLKLTPKRKQICERLNLLDSESILSYYPFRYEEYEKVAYSDFKIGSQVCFTGELLSFPSTFRRGRLSTTRFKVLYDNQILNITIFNRPWIRNIDLNEELTIIGKYDGNNKITASNYYTKDILGSIIPLYPLKEGITQNDIKKLISYTFEKCKDELIEDIPDDLVKSHGLIDKISAISNIHNPSSRKMLAYAMSRLKYEEFLRFYLGLNIIKGNASDTLKTKKEFSRVKIDEFINSLPYELTKDQNIAVDDVLKDLSSDKMMYRLIQGEVGCGKTLVATIGLYANYLSGYQGALMAPTEILAKQHFETIEKQLGPLGVRVGLLYSNLDNDKKIKQDLRNGDIDVIIGTHALFSEDVEYANLGLVIADEQQRFGVRQRQALKEKGSNCDFILMSATPIPRTLASSIYGDMDVSTIETMPAGRKGCKTHLINKNSIVDIIDELKKKLDEGRQIYLIAAAIEKSDNYKAKDVVGLYNSLIDVFKPYNVSLMHGKLDSEQKDRIMNDFYENKIQVLISTTVVEVGVNVKNATVMVIYDADKFGMAQIHQLRGRVQRSDYEGTCYLLSDNNDEDVLKRLNVLVNTNNGFDISYEDLRLRGPGDILGTRQSGLPAFIIGNLINDTKFIDAARKDAQLIIDNLDNKQYRNYYDKILKVINKNYLG